jgi:5-methylcytosine-specific restriction endonuclease McrA
MQKDMYRIPNLKVPRPSDYLFPKPTKKPRKGKKKAKATVRQHIPMDWKAKILERQRKKCAGKECQKLSGRKAPIDIMAHFDHKKPLAMGGSDSLSNLQGLCFTCHGKKTREDRYKISQWKKKQKTKKPTRRKKIKQRNPLDLSQYLGG